MTGPSFSSLLLAEVERFFSVVVVGESPVARWSCCCGAGDGEEGDGAGSGSHALPIFSRQLSHSLPVDVIESVMLPRDLI